MGEPFSAAIMVAIVAVAIWMFDKTRESLVRHRLVLGNKVIDHERVTGLGNAPQELAAIYEVTPQDICKVWFVTGVG